MSKSLHGGSERDRRGEREKHSPTRTASGANSKTDEPTQSKESGIFNLFRERGMLGGVIGSPGSSGVSAQGVYNPLTFKVEPIPEQNIRNILLSNQHTIVSHDANAFVDESDYTAHYGLPGPGGSSIYGAYREQDVDAWMAVSTEGRVSVAGTAMQNDKTEKLSGNSSPDPLKTALTTEISTGREEVNSDSLKKDATRVNEHLASDSALTNKDKKKKVAEESNEQKLAASKIPIALNAHAESNIQHASILSPASKESSSAAAAVSSPSALELLRAATAGPLSPSQQAVVTAALRGNLVPVPAHLVPTKGIITSVPKNRSSAKTAVNVATMTGSSKPSTSGSMTSSGMYKIDKNAAGEPVGAVSLLSLADIPPSNFSALVESCPIIAYECIVSLLRSEETSSKDYLHVLVTMDTSLQTMEVVNRLTTSAASSTSQAYGNSSSSDSHAAMACADNVIELLPADFINTYITNSIKSCEIQKDKYMQNRLVRLVCAFLVSLIRNGVVNIRDSYSEALAFCIEFSKIKEAAALFKILNKAAENS